jgi:ribosomal protein S6--L-glutamate ligase
MKILILATGRPSRHLVKAIEDKGHTHETHDPRNLYLFVSESENGYDRLYNGSSDVENPIRIKSKDIDAVISRIGTDLLHGTSILRHLSENLGIYSTQRAEGLETASNKLKTTQKLSSAGIRVPATMYAKNPVHINFLINKVGGLPAVGKLLQGSQGKGVFILETPIAANTALESLFKLNVGLKLQKFVDAGSKDIRAIVVGDKVVVAMERTGKKDFRANISQGGSGRKITLSLEDQEICVRASRAVGLKFSGVDILKDSDGRTYVIEVNGNPGSQIIGITGHNYFIDLVEMVESDSKTHGKSSIGVDVGGPDFGLNIEENCLWLGEKLNAQATRSWESAPWNCH